MYKKKVKKELKEIKVADIKFTYRNHMLIDAMKERGANIISQKWEKVEKSEKKIQNMLKENYKQLTTPTGAFITFEEDKGAEVAIARNKSTVEAIDILPSDCNNFKL